MSGNCCCRLNLANSQYASCSSWGYGFFGVSHASCFVHQWDLCLGVDDASLSGRVLFLAAAKVGFLAFSSRNGNASLSVKCTFIVPCAEVRRQTPKKISLYKGCFLDVLLVLLLVILISSMFYVHPEAVQAKNVIQINKIISDVLEHPHLPSGPLLLRCAYLGWQGS